MWNRGENIQLSVWTTFLPQLLSHPRICVPKGFSGQIASAMTSFYCYLTTFHPQKDIEWSLSAWSPKQTPLPTWAGHLQVARPARWTRWVIPIKVGKEVFFLFFARDWGINGIDGKCCPHPPPPPPAYLHGKPSRTWIFKVSLFGERVEIIFVGFYYFFFFFWGGFSLPHEQGWSCRGCRARPLQVLLLTLGISSSPAIPSS